MFVELMVHDYESIKQGYEDELIRLFEPYRCMVNVNNVCYLADVSEQVKDDGEFYQLRMNNDVSLVIEGRELIKLIRY